MSQHPGPLITGRLPESVVFPMSSCDVVALLTLVSRRETQHAGARDDCFPVDASRTKMDLLTSHGPR